MMRWLWLWVLSLGLLACRESLAPTYRDLPVPAGSQDQLRALWLTAGDTAYVAGGLRFDRDLLLKTGNGGATWTPQETEPPIGKILFALDFQNSQRGFV
ncbi:MAG: hypothetical protein D6722_06660, partial [Bacteroidetes bacterium]